MHLASLFTAECLGTSYPGKGMLPIIRLIEVWQNRYPSPYCSFKYAIGEARHGSKARIQASFGAMYTFGKISWLLAEEASAQNARTPPKVVLLSKSQAASLLYNVLSVASEMGLDKSRQEGTYHVSLETSACKFPWLLIPTWDFSQATPRGGLRVRFRGPPGDLRTCLHSTEPGQGLPTKDRGRTTSQWLGTRCWAGCKQSPHQRDSVRRQGS